MSETTQRLRVPVGEDRVEEWTVSRAEPTAEGGWRVTLVDPAGAVHQVDAFADRGGDVWTAVHGEIHVVPAPVSASRRRTRAAASHGLEAPMPATVTRVVASVGQRVAAGDVLVLLEAMKMELAVRAPRDGTVARIACDVGTIVQPGVPLVELT